jgi:Pilus formation protein N terminal region
MIRAAYLPRPGFFVRLAAITLATAAAPASASADSYHVATASSASMAGASDSVVKNLQLGVGKSVIVDLPQDAAEIYVGDPRIAKRSSVPPSEFMFQRLRTVRRRFSRYRGTVKRSPPSRSRSDATLAN